MIICVDFDGTCVTHDFPFIGKDIGAVPVLKRLIRNGHKLILWTMRNNGDRIPNVLSDAVNWFRENDIPLFGININPEQHWSSSPKAYAQVYVDDAALGCPLIMNKDFHSQPYVDWKKVEEMLLQEELI